MLARHPRLSHAVNKTPELPAHGWIFHPSKLRNPDSFPDNRQDNGVGMKLGFRA